ncbi:MAG: response regulator [Verrucomicrobia bacterium]|nr:response regulator [Verrucomicrobiota bacterium]
MSAAPTTEPPPAFRGTLLICDDEEGPRLSLRVVFKDEYNLLLASDGRQAIELAQQHRIDVAVLDIRMGGMSGIEVLERLKFIDPHIEVVMMTAFETADTMRQALRLRASDYINKPFDIATMRAAVGNAFHRRSLAGEIQDSAEQLNHLMAELQNQKVEEQISRTRGDIYASIIHDINSPLTVISGYIQMMNERIGVANQLEVEDLLFIKDNLKTITRQVTNCIEISRRYLGFLRRQSEASTIVGVNQLLTDLAELVRVHPSVQNNEFSCTPLAEDVTVGVNGTDLIQILLNLCTNAFQCTQQVHRVEVSGEVLGEPIAPAQIHDGPNDRWLNIESFDNTVPLLKLTVRDTGPGIPAEVLPKIFDAYFTTKSTRNGTGLGLSIVQRLVKAAKGLLHVHTQAGAGTAFTIYLPARRKD